MSSEIVTGLLSPSELTRRAADVSGLAATNRRRWASLEAVDRGDHVELITETRVAGTDRASNMKFAPYWALIRFPSGLIRRCWLAAIERTARGEDRLSNMAATG